jgi:transposase
VIPNELQAKILRYFHNEKWKPGTISRQLGVHHDTVARVLRDHGVPPEAIPRKPSIADPYVDFIVATLEKYPTLPASRLYEMVRERGYPGAPDHFRSVVRRYRPKPPAEAFLRLRTLPGEQAQVDWAVFGHHVVGAARRMLVAFVMVLSYSRHIFLRFGLDQRMGAFLRGHLAAFDAFGGVPRVILYDNLKSAVIERIGDAIRFNETLLAFASHQRFEPRPVAAYRAVPRIGPRPYVRSSRRSAASCWPCPTTRSPRTTGSKSASARRRTSALTSTTTRSRMTASAARWSSSRARIGSASSTATTWSPTTSAVGARASRSRTRRISSR